MLDSNLNSSGRKLFIDIMWSSVTSWDVALTSLVSGFALALTASLATSALFFAEPALPTLFSIAKGPLVALDSVCWIIFLFGLISTTGHGLHRVVGSAMRMASE